MSEFAVAMLIIVAMIFGALGFFRIGVWMLQVKMSLKRMQRIFEVIAEDSGHRIDKDGEILADRYGEMVPIREFKASRISEDFKGAEP